MYHYRWSAPPRRLNQLVAVQTKIPCLLLHILARVSKTQAGTHTAVLLLLLLGLDRGFGQDLLVEILMTSTSENVKNNWKNAKIISGLDINIIQEKQAA